MSTTAVAPCHLAGPRGFAGAARARGAADGSFSEVICRDSSKAAVDHKAFAFGYAMSEQKLSLRSKSARCAQLRSRPLGVAVTMQSGSFFAAPPVLLGQLSRSWALSCSHGSSPHQALHRPRRQQASFVLLLPRSPCRLTGCRAARRLALCYAAEVGAPP